MGDEDPDGSIGRREVAGRGRWLLVAGTALCLAAAGLGVRWLLGDRSSASQRVAPLVLAAIGGVVVAWWSAAPRWSRLPPGASGAVRVGPLVLSFTQTAGANCVIGGLFGLVGTELLGASASFPLVWITVHAAFLLVTTAVIVLTPPRGGRPR